MRALIEKPRRVELSNPVVHALLEDRRGFLAEGRALPDQHLLQALSSRPSGIESIMHLRRQPERSVRRDASDWYTTRPIPIPRFPLHDTAVGQIYSLHTLFRNPGSQCESDETCFTYWARQLGHRGLNAVAQVSPPRASSKALTDVASGAGAKNSSRNI